jgi:hypothetical protein
MTDYTKTVNFAAKDSLSSGDSNKIVRGTEINTEFDNIATAIATKLNSSGAVFTNPVSFPDGSASSPAITNTGDTNCGLFFSAADTLAFTAGGTSQFTMADGVIAPVTTNDVDLGTSSLKFKDGHFAGDVNVAGTILVAGDTAAGDDAAIGFTAAEGLILTGQGSTNDVTIKNDADTAVIQIPTGTTNVSVAGNLTVTGDLTVSGDDITMGTNTSGNLLIADGTNFNSVAVSSLSEISTIANDDVFLAIDTSGGGLKKVARSAVVSGLATSGAISNVVEDTTPQLGGDLDMNGQDIVTTSNADLELAPNGTGHVTVKGNTNAGAIQFNCESNSHGQIVKSQPHSAGVTNELLLPAGASSTLVSLVSTDTLTNKTLTTPVVNAGLQLKNGATSAGFLEFFEDSDNGTNKVTLIGPASTADITLTLPSSDGDDGQVLTTDGSGNLSFATSGGAYNSWLVKTSAYTALVGDQIIVNSSSAVTITLPASASAGNTVIIKATGGGTVTVGRNSQNINSVAADATIFSGNAAQLVYVDGTIGFLEI